MDMSLRPADLLNSRAKQSVLKFVLFPGFKDTAKGVSQLARVPLMTAHRVLRSYEDAGLVKSRDVGNSIEWSLNEDGYAYKALAPLYKTLFKAPVALDKMKEVIKEDLQKRMVLEAKLFGSMARGDYDENSDIDLLVVVDSMEDKKNFEKHDDKLRDTIYGLFGRHLACYVNTKAEFQRKKKLAVMKNIAKEGIKLI
jgi:predicted nucleotidyltransferase